MKKRIITLALFVVVAVSSFILGTTQAKTVEVVPSNYINMETEEFRDNYIDMRQVSDFVASETSLQILLENGEGYYWER